MPPPTALVLLPAMVELMMASIWPWLMRPPPPSNWLELGAWFPEIVLPVADSASPLDKGASDYIFLLINREGTFFFPLDTKVSERTYDEVTGKGARRIS